MVFDIYRSVMDGEHFSSSEGGNLQARRWGLCVSLGEFDKEVIREGRSVADTVSLLSTT